MGDCLEHLQPAREAQSPITGDDDADRRIDRAAAELEP
jgi:hypothetical protein